MPKLKKILYLAIFLSTNQSNAFLEPKAGHFRGLVGFEAKDLSFEAKAKDF